ncbi:MAG: lipopolysaccharide biosynthesis protein, partial [Planctomycetota bacterium]
YLLVSFTLCSALFQSLCDLLNAYYRSQHQPIKYAIVGISTALMLTVMSFVFLCILRMGVNGALLAKVITYGCVFSIIAWQIYSKTGFRISFGMIPELLRFGMPLSISAFGQFAITGASIYLISFHSGLDSVAVYSLGQKLASVLLMVLVLPFQLSFQPFVFSQLDTPDIKKQMARLLTYLMWSIAGGAFCILFASRMFLAMVMPPEFANAYLVTLMIMPAMAFVGLFYFAETLLKAVQKSSVIGLFVFVAALCSVFLNYVLIERFSWYGALIASNVIYFILAGSLLTVGLKSFPLPIEWKRLRTTALLFVSILIINLLLIKANLYWYCGVQVMVAGVIAFAFFYGPLTEEAEKVALKGMFYKIAAVIRRPTTVRTILSMGEEERL